jgi:myosin heavy subunit
MLAKAPAAVRESLGLTKWQDYKICNQKGTVAEVTTWNDAAEFEDMHEALLKVGFTEEARLELYKMLVFVLQLGNLDFKPGKEGSEAKDPKQVEACAALLQAARPASTPARRRIPLRPQSL